MHPLSHPELSSFRVNGTHKDSPINFVFNTFTGRNGGKSNKEMGGGSSTPAPGTASGSNSGNTTPAHKSSALEAGGSDKDQGSGISASAVAAAVAPAPPTSIHDPNHWSKKEKYDADAYLEGAYKKHLGRHANK